MAFFPLVSPPPPLALLFTQWSTLPFCQQGCLAHSDGPSRSVVSSAPSSIDLGVGTVFLYFCCVTLTFPMLLGTETRALCQPLGWPGKDHQSSHSILKEQSYLPLTLLSLPPARYPACHSRCVSIGPLLASHVRMQSPPGPQSDGLTHHCVPAGSPSQGQA